MEMKRYNNKNDCPKNVKHNNGKQYFKIIKGHNTLYFPSFNRKAIIINNIVIKNKNNI